LGVRLGRRTGIRRVYDGNHNGDGPTVRDGDRSAVPSFSRAGVGRGFGRDQQVVGGERSAAATEGEGSK